MSQTTTAAKAMIDVLLSWGVTHIYGIPGGSINSTLDALHAARDRIRYVQVRHEETGALAAAADAKLTGRVGVCFGSAGPGATHLFNGLYDARMDNVPMLALVGQVASTAMNYDSFQELNENPMFTDVAVYNRTVMTPASLPHVIDEAIRRAYRFSGPAVVTLPVDYGSAEVPVASISTAQSHRSSVLMPDQKDIREAVKLLEQARRPVIYFGQGVRGQTEALRDLAAKYALPAVSSVLAKGVLPEDTPWYMGTGARVGTKPANECLQMADLILFVGSDFPFASLFFPPEARFIQVDTDSSKLGRRHRADAAILGDAGEAMRAMLEGSGRAEDDWLRANIRNRENWRKWLGSFASSQDQPLRPESVFREINRIAEPDAVFMTDVGNVTIHAVRLLEMSGTDQRFSTSGWFATMGYAVPGALAAALSFPGRQVFSLNGDGGFSMAMHDIATQVACRLPIINIVLSNDSLGFIEAEQEDTGQPRYGVLLDGVDFARAGEAMGALGITVRRAEELPEAFDRARDSRRPVVIDVKIGNERPFPSEAMVLDTQAYSSEAIEAFCRRYAVKGMPMLRELLE